MARFLSNRDGGQTDEEGLYKFLEFLFPGEVISGFQVTQQDVVAMGVKVATGGIKIPSGNDYPYVAWQDAAANLSISGADPTNPRRDLIVAYIDLTEVDDSLPNNPDAFKLAVIPGTPAGSPSDPNETAIDAVIGASNPYSRLARVRVAAAASSITNAVIDDLRDLASLPADFVTANEMLYGVIRARQGGVSGDGSWYSAGSNNTDVSSKDVFIQAGSVLTVGGTDFGITFPVPYNQVPIVMCSLGSAVGFNGTARVINVTPTGATLRFLATDWSTKAAGEIINWVAIGQ